MGGNIHYLMLVTITQEVSMTTIITNIILNIKLLCINLNGA